MKWTRSAGSEGEGSVAWDDRFLGRRQVRSPCILKSVRSPGSQPFEDGVYRLYYVTLTDDRFVYTAAGRFQIDCEVVTVLDDPTGLLNRYLGSGPLTSATRHFLRSLATGSYREIVREEPGVSYLPRYCVRTS